MWGKKNRQYETLEENMIYFHYTIFKLKKNRTTYEDNKTQRMNSIDTLYDKKPDGIKEQNFYTVRDRIFDRSKGIESWAPVDRILDDIKTGTFNNALKCVRCNRLRIHSSIADANRSVLQPGPFCATHITLKKKTTVDQLYKNTTCNDSLLKKMLATDIDVGNMDMLLNQLKYKTNKENLKVYCR